MESQMDIEEQRAQVMKLMQDEKFVDKIARIEDVSEFVKCFEEKGINMSEHDAELIFKQREKIEDKFNNLSENELSDIVGGNVVIQNGSPLAPSVVVINENGHHRSRHREEGEPLTAMGGVAVGGVLSVIGIVLTAYSAYKWKKHGADYEL